MRYVISTIAFIFLINLNTKAQTKEETINWIEDKLYLYTTITTAKPDFIGRDQVLEQYIYIDPKKNAIIAIQQSIRNMYTGKTQYTYSFNLNFVYKATISEEHLLILYVRNNLIEEKKDDGSLNASEIKSEWIGNVTICIDLQGEENIQERLLRAFKNLIIFNNETKPKEAY
jgi:hypothetical protein